MPYKVGDATPGADNFGIEPLDSTSLGLPNLSWLSTQARPKDAYDTYWRNASRVPAGPVGGGLPGRAGGGNYQVSGINPTPGLSSFGFEALQMGPGGPNTVGGGLSMPNLAAALDPVRYSAHVPSPPLAPGVAGQPIGKPGQVTLDLIHPFTSFAQATGPYVGQAQLFGAGTMGQTGATGIDPMAFLAQRHVELLGNAPSRALDYLAAPFLVAARHLVGQAGPVSTSGEGLVKYAFQKDPNYWLWIRQANDTFMQQQAVNVANEYAPGYQNQGMQAALIEQFKRDQNTMLGLSSGDEAIDYRAKQHLAELIRETGADPSKSGALTNLLGELGQIPSVFLPALPVIGTQLGQFLDPVRPDTEAAWQKLTPEERGALLQTAGLQQTVGSMIATLPAFSGLGAVAAFGARAAEAGTFGGNIYRVYSTGIDVLAQAMKAGVGVALTNWAAEIAIPGYTDLIGREIDESRPVSDSVIGGMVNTLGYFASPADVLGPYLGLVTRPLRAAIGGGLKAIPIFKIGLGGPEMDAHVARGHSGPDLSAQAFRTDAQALTLSEMQADIFDRRQAMWQDAIKKGDPTGNFPVDVVSREQRIAHAEADLMDLHRSLGDEVVARVKIIEEAKKRPGFWDTAADRATRERLGYIRQSLEDGVALRYTSQYGPEFFDHLLSRQGLAYSIDGFKGWLQAQAQRQGWTIDMGYYSRHLGTEVEGVAGKYLGIGGDIEKWQVLARKLYHREFALNNGQLIAAAEGSEEAGRVMLARATHLFRADAVELAALIRDKAPEARAAAWQRIQNTEELARWWAEEKPGATGGKGIEDVKLSRLAAHLDSLSPMLMAKRIHPDPASPTATLPLNLLARKLEAEGQWVVGFKPQYARAEGDIMAPHGDAGGIEPTFVSYTHIGGGEFLRSPYLDYPMSSSDLIKIGGEGYVATKVDGLTRAFRSWRIGQFQEAMMHRIITRYDGVTAAQTDEFWHAVQNFAAAEKFGTKNIGVHVSPLAAATLSSGAKEIQAIGERIFGNRPMHNLDTGLMETPKWDEIARRSFSQSMKLNLTAGITSRFKQMGRPGEVAILGSEFAVPLLRFNLSPLFKIGEFVESKGLNFMRMSFERIDPLTRPLWVRSGITRERAMMRSEISADPQALALLTDPVAPRGTSAANYLTPTRSGRPNPIEAATAERPVPGIDMPGGADSPARPVTPADSTLREYQAAMADVFRLRDAEAAAGIPHTDRPPVIEPGLSPEEFRARARAQITQINARSEQIAGIADAASWPARYMEGGQIIVSRNTREAAAESVPGWRVTTVDAKGEPHGHTEARSMQEAIQDIHQGGLADVYGPPQEIVRRDGQPNTAPDPAVMRAAEQRYEAAREALLAQHATPWQAEVNAYQQRMDAFWERHGQPVQPINPEVGTIRELRQADAEVADAEARLVANPDDYQAMADLFAASDRRVVASETLRNEGPQPATELADMPGQPEHFERVLEEMVDAQPRGLRKQLREVLFPQEMKERAAHDLTIKLFRDIFPAALKASGSRVASLLRDELHVPESEWAQFMIEDKIRLQAVQDAGGTPAAWDALFAHADKYRQGASDMAGAELDALYQTPEWNVVSSLWLAAEQAARDESFGVHFFSKYRSPFARSINHPLLGVYPAAWAFKVAKEWFRFLYDNRAFGNGALRLGMTPAVAIAHIEDQQNRLMALTGSTMDDVIGFGGPLSSAFFMFNLILPGDWSALPFPFSRSIRLAMRGDFNPWDHIQQNTFGAGHSGGMGVLRDLRAGNEAAGEIAAAFGHIRSPGEVDFGKIGAIMSRGGVPPRPVQWRQVGNYPSK